MATTIHPIHMASSGSAPHSGPVAGPLRPGQRPPTVDRIGPVAGDLTRYSGDMRPKTDAAPGNRGQGNVEQKVTQALKTVTQGLEKVTQGLEQFGQELGEGPPSAMPKADQGNLRLAYDWSKAAAQEKQEQAKVEQEDLQKVTQGLEQLGQDLGGNQANWFTGSSSAFAQVARMAQGSPQSGWGTRPWTSW